MRLIDADEYKDVLYAKRNNPSIRNGIASAITMLGKQPTIDAVPVVRCRDCKYHRLMENKNNFMYWHNCELWCADIDEDAFCSYGERKEGENDG